MAFTPVTLPAFPNVPDVAGVPAVRRLPGGSPNTISGIVTGVRDIAAGAFTGKVVGLLVQASGVVNQVSGTLRGALDPSNNFAAVLSGAIGGNVLGRITGAVDAVTGVIQGQLSGVINQLTGDTSVFSDDLKNPETAVEPFRWGIFNSGGSLVLDGDSVAAFDFQKEYTVSNYPVEEGGFQSYNKVERPYDVRLTLTKGGTAGERTAFLADLKALAANLDLYSVATPEETYDSANVTGYSFRRTADSGANLIIAEIRLEQIRDTAVTTFVSTKTDAGAATINAGPVQAYDPTAAQLVAIDSSLEGAPVP